MPACYIPNYCGKTHSLDTGRPIAHNCVILPVEYLLAEREGRDQDASTILKEASPLRQVVCAKRIARVRVVRRYARP
jgi:hypothetical protein